MSAQAPRHTLAGSERHALPGATVVGDVHPDERIEVTLRLRPKTAPTAALADRGVHDATLPAQRRYLTRDEYAASHGADAKDLAAIEAFAKAHRLVVVESNAARCSVVLAGNAATLGAAFGVELKRYEHPGGSYRGRTGTISIPAELADVVQGVFGLDDRPAASPHFQVFQPVRGVHAQAAASAYTPPQLAALYNFPAGLDGSGECIAIIELGGGYRPADLTTYFKGLGIQAPAVKAVLIDHGHNAPTTSDSADGEVMLDIEVAGAIAPKASIVVYFAPNTDQGFLDAITTAVHDNTHKPSVISISWGSAESSWTTQSMTNFDQAFQAAAAMGVTVCVAAGDNGSADGVSDGKPHVDFPASSPNALGCGGTKLVASGTRIGSEVVWNEGTNSATGGGVSGFFALPAYQAKANVPQISGSTGQTGRGVPDVSGDADPQTGYEVRVDGKNLVFGGTSAVAPLWAGLVALMNQKLGRPVGFLNPLLYAAAVSQSGFHDIVAGNNGSYSARKGWDPCTGWGSPNGTKLLAALGADGA